MWLARPNRNPALSDLVESCAELSWLLAAGFVALCQFLFFMWIIESIFSVNFYRKTFSFTWMLR